MVPRLVCLLVLLWAWPLAGQGAGDERPVLTAAAVQFPPFIFEDEAGNAAGPIRTMTDMMAAEAGYQLEWKNLPINRVYMYLKEGHIDVWPGVAGLPHLQPVVYETDATLVQLNLCAFHKSDVPAITSTDQLKGHELILMSGYTYLGKLDKVLADPATGFSRAPSHEAALRMLLMGRGQYLLDYDGPMDQSLAQNPGEDLQRSPLSISRSTLVVSRANPDAAEIVERMDAAFMRLDESGALPDMNVFSTVWD